MQFSEDFSQYGGEYDAEDFTQYGGDDDLDMDQLEHFAYGGGNNSDDRRKFTVFEVDGEEKVVSVGVIRDADDTQDTEENASSDKSQDTETVENSGE